MGNALVKTLFKTTYALGGFMPFHWMNRNRLLILMYHRFSVQKADNRISESEFREHLRFLRRHNTVLPMTEVVTYLNEGRPMPHRTAVITIDDGYLDAYEIAFPLLREFGLPATLFAVTDFLDKKCWLWTDLTRFIFAITKASQFKSEFPGCSQISTRLTTVQQRLNLAETINSHLKQMPDEHKVAKITEIADLLHVTVPDQPPRDYSPMTWVQARQMDAENVKIESHTVTHPILTRICRTSLDHELSQSKIRLESELDRNIEHFCYPNGALDSAVQKAALDAGYKSAVTTNYGFNNNSADPFLLKRIAAQPAIEDFAQGVTGFEGVKKRIRGRGARDQGRSKIEQERSSDID